MTQAPERATTDFLPYLLTMAAERASQDFRRYYRDRYGMLRTEWRVLFHLGCYGALRAKDISERASIHKTKVSRAVAALETKRLLRRTTDEKDRRQEILILTRAGQAAFADLDDAAKSFDAALRENLLPGDFAALYRCLTQIIGDVPGDQSL